MVVVTGTANNPTSSSHDINVDRALSHLATAPGISAKDIVEGLCFTMKAEVTIPLDVYRPVLERRELGSAEYKEIADRFLTNAARFQMEGLEAVPGHFSESHLKIGLMALEWHRQAEMQDISRTAAQIPETFSLTRDPESYHSLELSPDRLRQLAELELRDFKP